MLPCLDAVPALNDDSCLTVFAINRSPHERPPLQIEKKVTPAPEGAKEKEEKKDEDADAE